MLDAIALDFVAAKSYAKQADALLLEHDSEHNDTKSTAPILVPIEKSPNTSEGVIDHGRKKPERERKQCDDFDLRTAPARFVASSNYEYNHAARIIKEINSRLDGMPNSWYRGTPFAGNIYALPQLLELIQPITEAMELISNLPQERGLLTAFMVSGISNLFLIFDNLSRRYMVTGTDLTYLEPKFHIYSSRLSSMRQRIRDELANFDGTRLNALQSDSDSNTLVDNINNLAIIGISSADGIESLAQTRNILLAGKALHSHGDITGPILRSLGNLGFDHEPDSRSANIIESNLLAVECYLSSAAGKP